MASVSFPSTTYSTQETPYVRDIVYNADDSETVYFHTAAGDDDYANLYKYTIAPTDNYGNVEIKEDFATGENIYHGILTGYNNGGDFTVYNTDNGEHFFWLFTSAPDYTEVLTLYHDSRGGAYVPPVACFGEGSRILTARGPVAIEQLQVGDLVATTAGPHRPIRWIGRRLVDARRPGGKPVVQIRFAAGAIAPNVPIRDLIVSPGHHMALDGAFVPAKLLVNGTTILREEVDEITWWHVELDTHDVILAEGAPSESYLDCGNRSAFENAEPVVQAHPDFERAVLDERAALPIVRDRERLTAVRQALLDRSAALGARFESDALVRVVADGVTLKPERLPDGFRRFTVPAGARSLRLTSRTAVPAWIRADATDTRELGVSLLGLRLDGEAIALDDARLTDGWHAPEHGAGTITRRWTAGDAALPVCGVLDLRTTGTGRYARLSRADAVAEVA